MIESIASSLCEQENSCGSALATLHGSGALRGSRRDNIETEEDKKDQEFESRSHLAVGHCIASADSTECFKDTCGTREALQTPRSKKVQEERNLVQGEVAGRRFAKADQTDCRS